MSGNNYNKVPKMQHKGLILIKIKSNKMEAFIDKKKIRNLNTDLIASSKERSTKLSKWTLESGDNKFMNLIRYLGL